MGIESNLKKIKNIREKGDTEKVHHGLLTTIIRYPESPCREGEKMYCNRHSDVKKAVEDGVFDSCFTHWALHGKKEGKTYLCRRTTFFEELNQITSKVKGPCP